MKRNDYRVLMVEDNRDHQYLMKMALNEMHIFSSIEGVEALKDAVEKSRREQFDLIILDYKVRDGTAFDFLESVTVQSPEVPIIMVTGLGDENVAVTALKKGIKDYIIKGRNYCDQLPGIISRVIENHELSMSLKHAETELRLALKRYEHIYASTDRGLAILDRDQKTLSNPNLKFLEIFSVRREDVEGRKIDDLFPVEALRESPEAADLYTRYLEGAFLDFHDKYECEIKAKGPDGAPRWFDLNVKYLPEFSGYLLSIADVTEKRMLTEDLRIAHEKLKKHARALELQVDELRKRLVIEPALESWTENEDALCLEKGVNYLIKEARPDGSFQIFHDLVTSGNYGLCIARTAPSIIREKYLLSRTPVIWLCKNDSEKDSLSPANLGAMVDAVREFTEKTEDCIILLEGIEYLFLVNGFAKVMLYLNDLMEIIVLKNLRLIVTVCPSTLDPKELAYLERSFEPFPHESCPRAGASGADER